MNVNKENMELFCQALESGRHEQIRGQVFGGPSKACALGVAAHVAGVGWVVLPYLAQEEIRRMKDFYGVDLEKARLKQQETDLRGGPTLIQANDTLKLDFWTIAQRIRETYLKDES